MNKRFVQSGADWVVRPEITLESLELGEGLVQANRSTQGKRGCVPVRPFPQRRIETDASGRTATSSALIIDIRVVFELVVETHVVHLLERVEVGCAGGLTAPPTSRRV